MMAYKTIKNESGVNFTEVTVLPREGSEPGHSGHAISVGPIPNGGSAEVNYGNDQNPFLNGFTLTTYDNGSATTITEVVTTRGSQFDNVLNTNSSVTISSYGGANSAGFN